MNLKWLGSIVIALGLVGSGISFALLHMEDQHIAECRKAYRENRYKDCISVCTQAYQESGKFKPLDFLIHAQYRLGNYGDVLQLCDELSELDYEGSAHYHQGKIYERLGLPGFARYFINMAFGMFQLKMDHANVSRAAHWLAGSYRNQAAYDKAIKYLDIAVSEAGLALEDDTKGIALIGLMDVFIRLGALWQAQQAQIEAERVLPDDTKEYYWAWLFFEIGVLRKELGHACLARIAFEKSLRLVDEAKSPDVALDVLLELADLDLQEGKLDSAAARLDKVHALAGDSVDVKQSLLYNLGRLNFYRGYTGPADVFLKKAASIALDPYWKSKIAYALGEVAEKSGNLDLAMERYREAVAHLDTIRNKLEIAEYKSWLIASKKKPYQALFELQLRSGLIREALDTTEQLHGRAFYDIFIETTGRSINEAGSKVGDVVRRMKALQRYLPTLNRSSIVKPTPIDATLDALRRTNVLSYFTARDRLWLIVLAENQAPKVVPLTEEPDKVESMVESWLSDLNDPDLGDRLGRILLPKEHLPEKGSHVYICPGHNLRRMPFEALRYGDGFFIQDYTVSYVPSLSSLANMLGKTARHCRSPAVVMGDPSGDLLQAQHEAEHIADLLGVDAYIGDTATESRFRSANDASLLHLSTHAGISPTGAWLLLAGDQRVDVTKIIKWRMKPCVAVLAGCVSGNTYMPDGWGSLAAAFLAAGTPKVIATLYSVDDTVTHRFMKKFYQIGGTRGWAKALAHTKRWFLESEPVSHWAPYVLYGLI